MSKKLHLTTLLVTGLLVTQAAWGQGGSIFGSLTVSQTNNLNLTTQGTVDWAVWGTDKASLARNYGKIGGNAISSLTDINAGSPLRALGVFGAYGETTFDWTDGTPTPTGIGVFSGLQHNNTNGFVNEGFSFNVPAAQTSRRLVLYFTTNLGIASITAALSDVSVVPFSQTFNAIDSANLGGVLTLDFTAATAGQNLLVTIKLTSATSTGANVAIQGATLAGALSTPVSITSTTLPGGTQGTPYSATITTSGGTAPFTWTALGLPQGLTINASGQITGTPNVNGSFPVTVKVTDSASSSASKSLNLSIRSNLIPLTVTGSGNLGSTSVGKPAGSGSFSAGGGRPPYSWSLSGAPQGITLSASGASATVSGTPSQSGVFLFSVTVTDADGQRASGSGSVSVLGLNTSSLPNATAFSTYSASLSAVGGQPPYSFTVAGLPSGLSVTGDGSFRGSPQRAGSFPLSITVSDSGGNTGSGTVNLQVDPAPVLTLAGTLPGGTINIGYSASVSASGGAPPYTFSLAGGGLPDGVRLAAGGGVSGTPTAVGTFGFTIRVTDFSGGSVTGNYSIVIAAPPVTITTNGALPSGMVNVDYAGQTLNASGGVGPYSFTVSSGNLPGGLALFSGGQLSGVPTTAGSFSFGVTATDTTGLTGKATFAVDIRANSADLVLSAGNLSFTIPAGSSTLPEAQAIRVQSTDIAQNLKWTVAIAGAAWLGVDRASGTTPGAFSIALTSAAAALGSAGSPYSATVTVSCASGPCAGKSQSVSVVLNIPALAPQLSVAPASLAFTAVSSAPAASTQTITITNSGGGTLGIGSITCGASWCKLAGAPPQLAAGVAGSINVTADPTALNPGFYWSAVDIISSGGKATVPVTFFIAANPSLTLAPSGFQTQVPAGGTLSIPPTSFNITVSTSQTVAWTASVTGPAWLKLGSGSGTASGSQPAVVSYSIDGAAISQLTPGTYYNSIRIASAGIVNSPQDFTVVVNVTAAADRQKPNPFPAGLLFLTSASVSPPAQSVGLFTSSNSTEPFQVSTSTDRGGAWLSASPSTGTTSSALTAQVNVAVDPSKLTPGVYRGQVDFALLGNAVRSVNVTVVVQAPAAALLPQADCCPRRLNCCPRRLNCCRALPAVPRRLFPLRPASLTTSPRPPPGPLRSK